MAKSGLSTSRMKSFYGSEGGKQTFNISNVVKGFYITDIFLNESADMKRFPITKFVELMKGSYTGEMLRIQNKFSFLHNEELGRGNVFIFTVGLHPAWSDLPTSNIFLPLLRRVIEGKNSKSEANNISFDELPEAMKTEINKSGIYTVGNELTQVNANPLESNPRMLNTELLEDKNTASGFTKSKSDKKLKSGNSLAIYLIIAIAILLVGEILLGNISLKKS